MIDETRLNLGWSRERLVDELNSQKLACGSGICPEIYREAAFKNSIYAPFESLPVAHSCGKRSIQFPVHPGIGRKFQESRVEKIKELFQDAFNE